MFIWCRHVWCVIASAPLGQRLFVCANKKSILIFFNYDRVKGYVPNHLGIVYAEKKLPSWKYFGLFGPFFLAKTRNLGLAVVRAREEKKS